MSVSYNRENEKSENKPKDRNKCQFRRSDQSQSQSGSVKPITEILGEIRSLTPSEKSKCTT